MTLSFRPMVELSTDHIHPDDLSEIRDYYRDNCWTSGCGVILAATIGAAFWAGLALGLLI